MKLRMELSSSPDSRTLANAWSWALLFEPECQFVAVQAIVGIINCLPFLLHYILNSLQLHIYCNWAMTSPNDIRLYQVHVHFNHCTSDLKHKKGKNLDCNKKTNLLSKFGSFISVMFFSTFRCARWKATDWPAVSARAWLTISNYRVFVSKIFKHLQGLGITSRARNMLLFHFL